ncbi:transposase [Streptomyces sp. NPDC085932]|uniref:transposase n=1 Tax=Streptomyces sp. NPDC085932 TaxID=3365741 RepID=UPI0037D6C2DD
MIDSSHIRAARRDPRADPAVSTARGRAPSITSLTDAEGIPLAVSLTGGNRNGVTQVLPLLDKIPAIAGGVGRPRRRPDALLADRG